jgi:putative peptidoglycan lipid II flippase
MDAYYAAFKIPDLIYNLLIIGALSAGFIPTFTKLFNQGEDKTEAWKLANNILNITAIALCLVSVCGIIFAHTFAPIIAPEIQRCKSAVRRGHGWCKNQRV